MDTLTDYCRMWDITVRDLDAATVTVDGDTATVDAPPIVARAAAMDALDGPVRYLCLNEDGTRTFARA